MEKRIIIGSRAFFEGMPDFQSKDIDILILTDTPKGFTNYRQSSMSGRCTIEWAAKPKEDFIAYALREKACGLEFGKFLVPEFATELGLTIEDLSTLYAHFKGRIDTKHRYQHLIYQAHVANNDFTLTDEQRSVAYEAYKVERPEHFSKKEAEDTGSNDTTDTDNENPEE